MNGHTKRYVGPPPIPPRTIRSRPAPSRQAAPEVSTPAPLNKVRELDPLLLTERAAAAFIGRSSTWLRNARHQSASLVAAGKPPLGPEWLVIGATIMYRVPDLLSYVERVAVPNGTVRWRGHMGRGAKYGEE